MRERQLPELCLGQEATARAVRGAGVKAISKPCLTGYNTPFSMLFLMRPDVLIEVEGSNTAEL